MDCKSIIQYVAVSLVLGLSIGCTHPLEVVGEGDIASNNNRGCTAEERQCDIKVVGAYQQQYFTRARRGWEFSHWTNCLTENYGRCEYNIDAETVKKNWYKTMAPLVATFVKKDTDADGVSDLDDFSPHDASCGASLTVGLLTCIDGIKSNDINSKDYGVAAGVRYIFSPRDLSIIRYDEQAGKFFRPIWLGTSNSKSIQLAAAQSQLLWHDSSHVYAIDEIEENTTPKVLIDAVSKGTIMQLVVSDDRIVLAFMSGEITVYDNEGLELSTIDTPYVMRGAAWSSATQRLLWLGTAGTTYGGRPILISHKLTSNGGLNEQRVNSEIRPHYNSPKMHVSPDGQELILPKGLVYNGDTLAFERNLNLDFSDVYWHSNGELWLVAANSNYGSVRPTSIYRLNANREYVERKLFDGRFLSSEKTTAGLTVNTILSNNIVANNYTPSDDSDADGVVNTSDAFPNDPSISLDSDGDGYPDAWNENFTGSTLYPSLVLDFFPNDYFCNLDSHGSNGVCEYNRLDPAGAASIKNSFLDDNGVIYFQSLYRLSLTRWSTNSNVALPPIILARRSLLAPQVLPAALRYNADNEEIFVSYTDGSVAVIDLANNNAMSNVANFDISPISLVLSDNHIVIASTSAAYSLNKSDYSTVDYTSNGYQSLYFWDKKRSRFYHRDSRNKIGYTAMDANGVFGNRVLAAGYFRGNTAYLSSDNDFAINDIGDIYSTETLHSVHERASNVVLSNWLYFSAITIENTDGVYRAKLWDETYRNVVQDQILALPPATLVVGHGNVYTGTITNGQFSFTHLAIADSDGDRLPDWWEDAHNLDKNNPDDAQLDSDFDSLSNILELENGTNPKESDTDNDGLTDGHEIIVSNTDPLSNDSDFDGLLDGDEVNTHASNPLSWDTDADYIPDKYEVDHNLNPVSSIGSDTDNDNDGFNNLQEFERATDPNVADSATIKSWFNENSNTENDRFVALTLDHTQFSLAWESPILLNYSNRAPIALQRKLIYIERGDYQNQQEHLVAIDADNGESLWRTALGVDSNYMVVSTGAESVYVSKYSYNEGVDVRRFSLYDGSKQEHLQAGNQWANVQPLAGGLSAVQSNYNRAQIKYWDENLIEKWVYESSLTMISPMAATSQFSYVSGNLNNENYLAKLDLDTGGEQRRVSTNSHARYQSSQTMIGASKVFILDSGDVSAYDANSLQPIWKSAIGASALLATGNGRLYARVRESIFVINVHTGEQQWFWHSPSWYSGAAYSVLTDNYLFLSENSKTIALDLASKEIVWSFPEKGRLLLSEGMLYIVSSNQINAIDVAGNVDVDGDGMPAWWEQTHQLDDSTGSDATIDTDSDGLNNLQEFIAGSEPRNSDTDGDLIDDGAEVDTHNTDPSVSDSDADGLSDSDEVNTHLTNPLLADSDGDSFPDGAEVKLYNSDPLDDLSIPSGAISHQWKESFEDSEAVPSAWTSVTGDLAVSSEYADEGTQALRMPFVNISSRNTKVTKFKGLFADGILTYNLYGQQPIYDGSISVYVDGEHISSLYVGLRKWTTFSLPLTSGEHTIEWKYNNYGVYDILEEHYLLIDNLSFNRE